MVEQLTFNQLVVGSIPTPLTKFGKGVKRLGAWPLFSCPTVRLASESDD